jgi:hypothetical protein
LPPPVPGEFGWIWLEYAGNAPGVRRWTGPATGQPYRFGADKRIGKVDKRDAIEFLKQRTAGGAERIWRLYRA